MVSQSFTILRTIAAVLFLLQGMDIEKKGLSQILNPEHYLGIRRVGKAGGRVDRLFGIFKRL